MDNWESEFKKQIWEIIDQWQDDRFSFQEMINKISAVHTTKLNKQRERIRKKVKEHCDINGRQDDGLGWITDVALDEVLDSLNEGKGEDSI